MEELNCNLITCQQFAYLCTETDDSTDARDSVPLLILLRSVNDKYVINELFSTDAMKGTIAEDYEEESTILKFHKFS